MDLCFVSSAKIQAELAGSEHSVMGAASVCGTKTKDNKRKIETKNNLKGCWYRSIFSDNYTGSEVKNAKDEGDY